jgi:hypothetical protein
MRAISNKCNKRYNKYSQTNKKDEIQFYQLWINSRRQKIAVDMKAAKKAISRISKAKIKTAI